MFIIDCEIRGNRYIFSRYVNDICKLWKSTSLDQRLNRCSSCFDVVTSFHRFLIASICLFFYALTLNLQLVLRYLLADAISEPCQIHCFFIRTNL